MLTQLRTDQSGCGKRRSAEHAAIGKLSGHGVVASTGRTAAVAGSVGTNARLGNGRGDQHAAERGDAGHGGIADCAVREWPRRGTAECAAL